MMIERLPASPVAVEIHMRTSGDLDSCRARLETYLARGELVHLSRHPSWLRILERGLGHVPYCLEAIQGGRTCGFLALAYVRSLLFGRFLVSLPYVNYGGPVADDGTIAARLID